MDKWIEVLRTGSFKDRKGKVHEFSEADLDQMVASYDPKIKEAPLVIGHPKTDSPAWGWVEALKREGERLFAKPKQVVSEFAEMVNKGMFKKRSVALNEDLSLRHVGFLGAQAPAVPGLADFQFSENENDVVFEFSDENEDDKNEQRIKDLESELAKLKSEKIEFAEMESKLNMEITERVKAETELKKLYLEKQINEFKIFLNERISYGSLLPKHEKSILKLLELIDTIELSEKDNDGNLVFCFSDGDKESPTDLLKEFLSSLPKSIEFSEIANNENCGNDENVDVSEFSEMNVDQDRLELHKKAKSLAEKENISYELAINKVLK